MDDVLRRLVRQHGPRPWKCHGKALDVLVEAMLAQNTSMHNAAEGYRRLRRDLPTWSRVMAAPVEQVQRGIAICGLSRMRARRLQALLRRIQEERGRLTLEWLGRLAPGKAYAYLMSFHGVGPKTAAYTLLFAFNMPLFPVDGGIVRLARRLRIVPARGSERRIVQAIERATAERPDRRYPLHVLMFRHAKTVCRPRNPRCDECRLLAICPTGQLRIRKLPPPKPELPYRKRRPPLAWRMSDGLNKGSDDAPSARGRVVRAIPLRGS